MTDFQTSEYEYHPNLTERVSRVYTLETLGYVCSPRGHAYTILLELQSGSCGYHAFSGRISLSDGSCGHGAALQDAVKGIGFARLENMGSTHKYPW